MAIGRGAVVGDGLWHCLRPAFAVGRQLTRAASIRITSKRAIATSITTINRYSTVSNNRSSKISTDGYKNKGYKKRVGSWTTQDDETASWEHRLVTKLEPNKPTLQNAPIDEITSVLGRLRDRKGWDGNGQHTNRFDRILLLTDHLLGDRDQPLSAFAYECIMDAMIHPKGDSGSIRKLFQDMSSNNIELTASFCQSALDALANHPHYLLRQEVLELMEENSIPVDLQAKQSVLLGLLRDEQYELAYTRILSLGAEAEADATIEAWVYDVFIIAFGLKGILKEMMVLLEKRRQIAQDVKFEKLLYFVLDIGSSSFHADAVKIAWAGMGESSARKDRVPDGMLENILGTAARHGDVELATEMLDLLSGRGRLRDYHYEAVTEAQLQAGDLEGAMRVCTVMEKNGLQVTSSMLSLFENLVKAQPDKIVNVDEALETLSVQDNIAVALLQSIIKIKAAVVGGESVVDLLDKFTALTGRDVTPIALQEAISNCADVDIKSRFSREYESRFTSEDDDPVRSKEELGSVIQAFVDLDNLNMAFRLAKPLLEAEWEPEHSHWVLSLAEKAVKTEDSRIWKLVDVVASSSDANLAFALQKMLSQSRMARRAADLQGSR